MLDVAVELIALAGRAVRDRYPGQRPCMHTPCALVGGSHGITGHSFLGLLRIFLKTLEC